MNIFVLTLSIWAMGMIPAILVCMYNDNNPIDIIIWPIFVVKYFILSLFFLIFFGLKILLRIWDVLTQW